MSNLVQRLDMVHRRAKALDATKPLGRDGDTWNNWKKSKGAPNLKVLQRMREALGISLDWLATGEGPMDFAERLRPLDPAALRHAIERYEALSLAQEPSAADKAKLITEFYDPTVKRNTPQADAAYLAEVRQMLTRNHPDFHLVRHPELLVPGAAQASRAAIETARAEVAAYIRARNPQ